jgi:hypothetical protein
MVATMVTNLMVILELAFVQVRVARFALDENAFGFYDALFSGYRF